MGIGHFLAVLRERLWVVLWVLVLTVGTTVVVSLLLPKQYVATAAVVIDAKPDPIAGPAYQNLTNSAFMATQVDILESDRVALHVIRKLNLAKLPEIREQWMKATEGKGTFEVWLVGELERKLTVTPSRESNVINVSFKANNPVVAASMANAFVQGYMDTSVDLRVNPAKQYSDFFDLRAKGLRENLERAQAKLSEFQREKGIIGTDERLDVENSRLNDLSTQLVALQALSADSSSRSAQAVSAGDRLQEVLNNPVISGIKADLSRAEVRLKELNSRLGQNHPQVVEANASINELRARLDSETRRVTAGVGVSNTINRQREAESRAALEAQRAKMLKMKALRDEGSVLLRDVENAQRAYDTVLTRLNQSSLESQTTLSNIYPLTQAAPPTQHASPKLLLNAVLAVFIGGVLAVGVALLLESMDRRLRVVEDVIPLVGLPVLGVMPKPNYSLQFKGRHRMPLLSNRHLRLPSNERAV